MKDNRDLKILEILDREDVSARLRNAMRKAASEGLLPFETLYEYLQKKNDNIQSLFRIPKLGNKSVYELVEILDKYIEKITITETPVSASPQQIFSISIPAPYKNISLLNFIQNGHCSVRLSNALTGAIERKEFKAERLGDLEGMSIHALRSELWAVPNLGNKSINEFIDLLNTFLREHAAEFTLSEVDKYNQPLKQGAREEKSGFASLLENSGFSKLTVSEIIKKTPGIWVSKQEITLLKNLDPIYYSSTLFDLLVSISNDIYEVSEKIITNISLAPRLAGVLEDFYKFLLSDKDQKFNYSEYFKNHFSGMKEREVTVLLERLGGKELTLEELGEHFHLTRERIRQIESGAIKKYLQINRIGMYHLSKSLENYIKASKGVISVKTLESLYRVPAKELEVVLHFIVPSSGDGSLVRNGDHIVSRDFKFHEEQLFNDIKAFIYRNIGIDSKRLIAGIKFINRPILEYFIFKNKKMLSINDMGEIEFISSSASERAYIVLEAAGQPLHTREAVRLYSIIFKEDITEHALGSTFNRLTGALIVGPGTFALYSHIKLNPDEIKNIRDDVYKLISKEGRHLSSRVIFKHVCQTQPELRQKEPSFNFYMVHGIIQDDRRFLTKRGFMVGLPSFGDYIPLETEVSELVETNGPVSISGLIELLRPTRGELTNGSVRNCLVASDEIYLTAEKRQWDVAERVFRDPADIRRLQVAIRMAAYKETVALSSIYNRIRSTGIEYALGTILSIVWKDQDITLQGDYVRFDGTDAEIENYYATGEPATLWELDYRNHTEEKSVDTGLLDTLLKEFDLDV